MKLSEAIRLGSMLAPQGFDSYKRNDKTCAIGAAMHAISGKNIVKYFPILRKLKLSCPMCVGCQWKMYGLIIHLNDYHRWTREAIADFIEEIENESERTRSSSYRHEFDREGYKEKVRTHV